jgi:hypothetical protein
MPYSCIRASGIILHDGSQSIPSGTGSGSGGVGTSPGRLGWAVLAAGFDQANDRPALVVLLPGRPGRVWDGAPVRCSLSPALPQRSTRQDAHDRAPGHLDQRLFYGTDVAADLALSHVIDGYFNRSGHHHHRMAAAIAGTQPVETLKQ